VRSREISRGSLSIVLSVDGNVNAPRSERERKEREITGRERERERGFYCGRPLILLPFREKESEK
jgi:hypothetical protein